MRSYLHVVDQVCASHAMEEVGESIDAATGQKAPKKVGRKRKRSEVDGECPDKDEERMNIEDKSPKRKVSVKFLQ